MEGMQAWDNLAHQITMLAINPRTGRAGRVGQRSNLALAAAAGALAELALQERVALVDKRVHVHDSRPTEDPLLDIMLGILDCQPDRRPTRILNDARNAYMNQALSELVTNGWVTLTSTTSLFGPRYRVIDTERLERARELAASAFRDPDQVSARAACLGGLASELSLAKALAPELKWRARLSAQAKLRRRDWVVKAVHDVIAARAAAASAAAS